MRAGLVRGEFELFYQPTVDVWTRHVSCVDARLRWCHPVHGLMSSDRFLSVAESTGLIVDLGEWVLRQACRDAKAWPEHVKVAVNLSALQFRSVKVLDAMRLALGDAGLPPSRLEIEVSEAILMDKQSGCLALLNQLRDVGVSVALDDFGTRHSSLSCLMMFSFDKIKIDGSLTSGVTERADCAAIVSAILGLGRSLGIVTSVAGVETDRQLEILRAAGASFGQGGLFGEPIPSARLDFGDAEAVGNADTAA
jgi:EAL domain-containing protein (putative c-di-GMP-specific phosphodiesterase class I)